MKRASCPLGRGLKCRRERLIARLASRVTQRRQRLAALPEKLTVHARFACHRWHALCGEVHVNDYGTLHAAVYAAAQEAFARLLGEGVPLRCIHLSATDDDGIYIARFEPEVAA